MTDVWTPDLVGKVCRCSNGRPGLVTGRKTLPWGESWVGVVLSEETEFPYLWSSREPDVVAENLDSYLEMGDEPEETPLRAPDQVDQNLRRFATVRQWEHYCAWVRHGSTRKAAKALGVAWSSVARGVRGLLRKAAQQGYAPEDLLDRPVPEGMTSRGVSTLIGADGEMQQEWHKTRQAGREPDEAHPPLPVVDRVSTQTDAQGKVTQQWVSTKREEEDRLAAWRAAAEELGRTVEPAPTLPEPEDDGDEDLLVGYPVGDLHLGMLSWDKETDADWDLRIGERVFDRAIAYLVGRAPRTNGAVLAVLGDFFHYDSFEPVTPTSRNMLDSDGRYPKMIRVAIRSLRRAIETVAAKHHDVLVIVEVGNHDLSSSVFLTEALRSLYERNPRITVDDSPKHFHYFRHGACLVGTHHGHGVKKPEQLAQIMAADRPEAWGQTRHRYWWTGHVHNLKATETPGCVVESFRVLAPQDAWSHQKGYRAAREMKAIVLHREHGEVSRLTVNPGMFR